MQNYHCKTLQLSFKIEKCVKYRFFFLLTDKGWADVPLHRTPRLGTLNNRLRKRKKKNIPSDNNQYDVKKGLVNATADAVMILITKCSFE